MDETIAVFCGEVIDDMSREDLIEALKTVGRCYEKLLQERKNLVPDGVIVDGRYIRFGNEPL